MRYWTTSLVAMAMTALSATGVRADSAGGNNTTVFIGVGAAVVVILLLSIFFWMRQKKHEPVGLPAMDQQYQAPNHLPRRSAAPPPSMPPHMRQLDNHNNGNNNYKNPGDWNATPAMRPAPPQHPQVIRHAPPPPPPNHAMAHNDPPRRPPPQPAVVPRGPVVPSAPKDTPMTASAMQVADRILKEFENDQTIGRQKIQYSALYFTRVLSKGAFGEVWLAQLGNRQVAVKRILHEKKNDEKEIECFAAEIKLMASFYHPKIVEFVGVSWSTLQDLCAVTEYMAKGDLYGFLKRKNGQINWEDHKIFLAEDVADALVYLHSLTPKVIHRDLKSKNILLDDNFRAKLSDFGISRERSLEETMTAGVGTIYWTAPEVLMGKKYTEKADIYSFGIVMSELDTHEVPYSDKRDEMGRRLQGMKVVQMVIKKKLRPAFDANCPADVRDLAMRCLDAEPDVRPDAPELLRIIQRIQQIM